MARRKKSGNGSGSPPRKVPGRDLYETRATLDTPTGRKRVSFYGKTSREADEKKFQALADQSRGVLFSDPQRLTVVEYLERWLSDSMRYQVAQSTYGRYERTVRNHFVPFFRSLRLRDIQATHIRALKARKLDEGLDPDTVGVIQGVLSGALNQAVSDGLIPLNPCSQVKKAKKRGKNPMRSLTEVQASALAKAAEGTPEEAIIVMALRTGMRQGELAALRWENLDLESSRPTVTVCLSADTRTKTVVTATKTGEDRTLRIGPRMVEVLRRHRAAQLEKRLAASTWEDPGWVFPNSKGKVRRRDTVTRHFRDLLEAAGIPEEPAIRFHDLRHTAGTLALKRGRSIPEVSKLLGHADPAMTLRRYAHVLDEMEDDTARAMDDLF